MEMTTVPEINASEALQAPDAAALALTGNTQEDLRAVAKELGVTLDANGNVEAQPAPVTQPQIKAEPAQPQAAAEPKAEIPAKFQNPDGTVNVEKLEKSTASLDEAIARYRAKEREFSQTHNKVNNSQPAQPVQQANLSPFEVQLANDLLREAQAVGEKMSEGHAVAQARVIARAVEAKYNAEMDATQDLRRRVEDNERSRELQGLINEDQGLLAPEMVDKLWTVRQENPWLNKAPEPWKAAYTFLVGQQSRGGQVKTPNPTGQTAKAPPAPVGPVSRVVQTVNLNDKASLQSLTDAQLEALVREHHPGYRGR